MTKKEKAIFTLIPPEDFKAFFGIDDREDKIIRFCLESSTFAIEQYCKRRFLRKKHSERFEYIHDLFLPLREYPVIKVRCEGELSVRLEMRNWERLDSEFYRVIPDCGSNMNFPYSIELSPALRRFRRLTAIKAVYWAGYTHNKIPTDLKAACYELAAWNMSRYKGRGIGMTGNVRKDGERFELAMPENVKSLLEAYRRKTI